MLTFLDYCPSRPTDNLVFICGTPLLPSREVQCGDNIDRYTDTQSHSVTDGHCKCILIIMIILITKSNDYHYYLHYK